MKQCSRQISFKVEAASIATKVLQHHVRELPLPFQNYRSRILTGLRCNHSVSNPPINQHVGRCESTRRRRRDTYSCASNFSTNTTETVNESKQSPNVKGHRRRLDIAIVGLPNAGKSQLLNILTGTTVSAVSRKRHTTRQGVMAARTITKQNDRGTPITTQLLFVDTPGFVNVGSPISSPYPKHNKTDRNTSKVEKVDRDLMVSEARREMVAVDYTVIVIDAARRFTDDVRATTVELMMMAIASQGRIEDEDYDDDDDDDDDEDDGNNDDSPKNDTAETKHGESKNAMEDDEYDVIAPHQKFAIVLNKVDLIEPKSSLLDYAYELGAIAQDCLQYRPPTQHPSIGHSDGTSEPLDESILDEIMPMFFYTSALHDEGVDDLLKYLLQKATPARVFEVEPGMATNLLPEERAEEVIREKIYRCLHKEIPYQIQQQNRVFKVTKDSNNGILGLYIEQDLLVASRTHQALVRGRGNQTLERMRESAEFTMKSMFHCDVTLKLNVKFSKSKNQRREIYK
jgi:GTPase